MKALVIGGSIAGLAAARVLSERFAEVTILDRDRFQGSRHPRAGVPQSRHLHALLARGLQAWEELVPGTENALLQAGAQRLRQEEFRLLYPSGWNPQTDVHLRFIACTRTLLEGVLRELVLSQPNIRNVQSCDVTGLELHNGAVIGVQTRSEGMFPADLVVDASGRSSKTPAWLDELGYGRPEETVIDAFYGYATRIYTPPPNLQLPWKQLFIFPRPPHLTRGGILQPIEGGRWLITVGGVNKDYPPTDEQGFLDFVRSLASSDLYKAIRHADPVTPVLGFRHTENRWRHYERMRMPERLIVLGDAACAFNPIYGQGMTVAALQALALKRLTGRADLCSLSREFPEQLAKVVKPCWTLATGEDLRWPGTVGAKPDWKLRAMHRYLDRVIALVPEHPEVFRRFVCNMHMTMGPGALFHPAVLAPMLRRFLSRPKAGNEWAASVGEA